MAEAEEKEKQGAEKEEVAEGGKKGGKKKLIIIALVLIILVGGGVGGAFAFGLIGGPPPGEQPVEETPKPLEQAGPIISLEPFIVNLADEEDNRYLKVSVGLEVKDEEIQKACEERMPRIKDIMITLFSSKTNDQVRDVKGKIKLRQEIVIRINEILGEGAVKNVFFTEFIVS